MSEGQGEGTRLVAIGTVGDPIEGGMIREFLVSHGIDCLVQGEHHRSMVGWAAAIELRLLVPEDRAEEAALLLREFRQTSPRDEGEDQTCEVEPADEREDSWRDDAELSRRMRGGRLLALVLPGLGIAHFTAGARVRGFILLMTWPAVWWLAGRMGLVALALVPLSTLFDAVAAPVAMGEVQRKQRAERLPPARALPPRD